jgi:hypothetical protein
MGLVKGVSTGELFHFFSCHRWVPTLITLTSLFGLIPTSNIFPTASLEGNFSFPILVNIIIKCSGWGIRAHSMLCPSPSHLSRQSYYARSLQCTHVMPQNLWWRPQFTRCSAGSLIKTMSPPLDLKVLTSKIVSWSMTTIQSTSVTWWHCCLIQTIKPSQQITHLLWV